MSGANARLRMFAGPNGSGKTTVKNSLGKTPSWFGIYINPDDLEATIRSTGVFSPQSLGLSASVDEVRHFFVTSPFLESQNLAQACAAIAGDDSAIDFLDSSSTRTTPRCLPTFCVARRWTPASRSPSRG